MAKKKQSKNLKQKFDAAYVDMRGKDSKAREEKGKKGCDCGGCGR